MNDTNALPMTVILRLDVPYKQAKRRLLDIFESTYFEALIRKHHHNLSAASREANLSRRHLRSLLRRYGLYRAPTSPGVTGVEGAPANDEEIDEDFDEDLGAVQ